MTHVFTPPNPKELLEAVPIAWSMDSLATMLIPSHSGSTSYKLMFGAIKPPSIIARV